MNKTEIEKLEEQIIKRMIQDQENSKITNNDHGKDSFPSITMDVDDANHPLQPLPVIILD